MTKALAIRFNEKWILNQNTGCWDWTAGRYPQGYGKIRLRTDLVVYAHRVSWMLYHGDIPKGINVLHSCDNPGCVNPEHLFLGTHADNTADMMRKGRARQGHLICAKLDPASVLEIRNTYAAGKTTYRALAKKYGVTDGAIFSIVHKRTWKHVK